MTMFRTYQYQNRNFKKLNWKVFHSVLQRNGSVLKIHGSRNIKQSVEVLNVNAENNKINILKPSKIMRSHKNI